MKFNKKITTLLLTGALSACLVVGATGCSNSDSEIDDLKNQLAQYEQMLEEIKNTYNASSTGYAAECYAKLQYMDKMVKDRDCIAGENFKYAQKWIASTLINAGYNEEDIVYQPSTFSQYYKKTVNLDEELSAVDSYETDGKYYNKENRKYVEAENGEYVKVNITTPNIAITKKGKSEKQIIVGAHYDGDGTGDNGSGVSLALTTAEKIANMDLQYTITFVFFTEEEYGCYGSTTYANSMTEEQIANTLYMINLDSLVCGDYAYIYGGVQDDENKIVTKTEAYDNAMAVATSLGLSLKSNPWTWDNPAPGYETPDYASPSTGNWSDHKGFKAKGIPYVYFEATNWEIPGPYKEYDGYGETYLVGMLMNTKNDYLEYINKYFPGRIMKHFETFSTLLYALVIQNNVNF
ncbi:MAG: M28 family peptidase [Clostridia bacterium]|nr:M28 family peptidase [Clostridia bacterium]